MHGQGHSECHNPYKIKSFVSTLHSFTLLFWSAFTNLSTEKTCVQLRKKKRKRKEKETELQSRKWHDGKLSV